MEDETVPSPNNTDPNASASDSEEERVKKRKERPWEDQLHGNLQTSSSSLMPSTQTQSSVERRQRSPRDTGHLQDIASIGGLVAETAARGLTPYEITVNAGEDVVSKISTFWQKGPRAACILSASGAASTVVIRRPGSLSSTDTLRFEGLFEILSLSGSYSYPGDGASRWRRKKSMLNITLANSDGSAFGGALVGPLIAAGPVQLVVARFDQKVSKNTTRSLAAGSSAAPEMYSNPDPEGVHQNVPGMIEGKSCPSPTSGLIPTTNVLPENTAATTTRASDNVIPPDQNMHSASASAVGLDSQLNQNLSLSDAPGQSEYGLSD